MWIVVAVNPFYPSVFHFNSRAEAVECYEHYKKEDTAVHLAKVQSSNFNSGRELYPVTTMDQSKGIDRLNVVW